MNINTKEIIQKLKDKKLILCEGINSCVEALKNDLTPQFFIINTDKNYSNDLKELEILFINKGLNINNYLIFDNNEKISKKISTTKTIYPVNGLFEFPQNILINYSNDSLLNKKLNFELLNTNVFFAFENIQDPGNLGTIIRTLVSFNFDYLILIGKNCTYPFSPKVIRSSSGNIFYIKNIFFFNTTKDFIDFSKRFDLKLYSLSLDGLNILKNKSIFNKNDNEKKIFIFGNEGRGISKEILEFSHLKLKIPISENVESLNVSISVSIIAWEVFKNLNKDM